MNQNTITRVSLLIAICIVCLSGYLLPCAVSAENQSASIKSPALDAMIGEWIEYDITELMNGAMPLRERITITGIESTATDKKFQIKVAMTATPPRGGTQVMQEKTKTIDNIPFFERANFSEWCPDMIAAICEPIRSPRDNAEKIESSLGEETVTIQGKKLKTNTITTGIKMGEMEYTYFKFYISPDLPASGIVQVDLLSSSGNATLTKMVNYGWGEGGSRKGTQEPVAEAIKEKSASAVEKMIELELKLADNVSIKLNKIPAGSYLMGSPESDETRYDSKYDKFDREFPHKVTITRPFYIGIFEVTQEQYVAIMRDNPSHHKGRKRPVQNVSWDNAVAFCKKATEVTGKQFRLPTEAEWEYACRAGSNTVYNFGDIAQKAFANFGSDETVDVGSYAPNAWGLYDMHGNVREWCMDWFGSYYTTNHFGEVETEEMVDPVKDLKESDPYRVLRGGDFDGFDKGIRSASRGVDCQTCDNMTNGFRVVVDE